jgi:hypothetical protein
LKHIRLYIDQVVNEAEVDKKADVIRRQVKETAAVCNKHNSIQQQNYNGKKKKYNKKK